MTYKVCCIHIDTAAKTINWFLVHILIIKTIVKLIPLLLRDILAAMLIKIKVLVANGIAYKSSCN